jgi:hypothetical protein
MPVLPSDEARREVRQDGSQAVKVLADCLNSTDGLEQHLSLRLFFEFRDDAGLRAFQAFAERSCLAGIRQEAIAGLMGFAAEKVRPIIERASRTDPDPDVRAHARRMLASLPASPQQ